MTPITLVKPSQTAARSLKTLVPLIQEDLRAGAQAGLAYYRRAGDKLREARDSGQVAAHRWQSWLKKNFNVSRMTAWRYMKLSELTEEGGITGDTESLLDALAPGTTAKKRSKRKARRAVDDAITDVDVEELAQARDTREEETKLHRDLALQLIDIGYKALATRLHPDRGGSQQGMRRLNRVRDELKSVAQTRRFE